MPQRWREKRDEEKEKEKEKKHLGQEENIHLERPLEEWARPSQLSGPDSFEEAARLERSHTRLTPFGSPMSSMTTVAPKLGLQKWSPALPAHEGATCDLLGKIYRNGESFQPNCKLQCICMDGAIGCIPLCTDGVRLPSADCPFPRRVKVKNKCCEEWVCEKGNWKNHHGRNTAGETPMQEKSSAQAQAEAQAQAQSQDEQPPRQLLGANHQMESLLQDKGKKCVRNAKSAQAIRFEFTGCTSTRSYRPKFCGRCTDGRCCTPLITSTTEVEFKCPEGDSFVRKMMIIKSCKIFKKNTE
ncbi:hypothetical protein JD844_005518 [Phrynosoma platyrhinos]|uniref:Connective tissue growth factor n=1 Tax=Phrynosoma platyrhinos TaxID=52577 RepID=A0ABQ7TN85_PHRPL|nr:hypothetical protein JD844_005518 [Phrynosoma platyrhinos]